MKFVRKVLFLVVFMMLTVAAFADWNDYYFRGTPNNWGTTKMEKIDRDTWKIVVRFNGGDEKGGPRFKISKGKDWNEAYPDRDYKVDGDSTYEITFRERGKEIFVKRLRDEDRDHGRDHDRGRFGWENCYFRGTPNGWGSSEMEKVGKNLWMIRVRFRDGEDGAPRFKISKDRDWNEAYPKDDYRVGPGVYEIYFNDKTKEKTKKPKKRIKKNMIIIEKKIEDNGDENNNKKGKTVLELKAELK